LIGTTQYLPGNVFQMSPPESPAGTWSESSLLNFNLKHNGAGIPSAGGIVYSGNAVFGTLTVGGSTQNNEDCRGKTYTGCGAIYSLSPPSAPDGAWTENIIYTFAGSPDGADPMMIMPTANGFIGVTTRGGIPQRVAGRETVPGCGTVFQLTGPTGEGQPWTESILYTFQEGTDCFPESSRYPPGKCRECFRSRVGPRRLGRSIGKPSRSQGLFRGPPPSAGFRPWW
jgi:hypothetical protein